MCQSCEREEDRTPEGSAITGLVHGCAFMALCFTGGWAYAVGGWAWALPGALVAVWWRVGR